MSGKKAVPLATSDERTSPKVPALPPSRRRLPGRRVMLYLVPTLDDDTLNTIIKFSVQPIVAPWDHRVHLTSFTFHARTLKAILLTNKSLRDLVDDSVWTELLNNMPRERSAYHLSGSHNDAVLATIEKIHAARNGNPPPPWTAPWLKQSFLPQWGWVRRPRAKP